MSSDHAKTANILVVDDTPDNLRLLSAILSDRGYVVRKALSGQLALTACQRALPDLILLDINMPGMNGYEVCQQLKVDGKTCEVPVIFISALDDVLDKVKAFDIGGVDYITKPFQGAEVISRIENQLNLRSLQIKLQQKNILLEQVLEELKNAQLQLIQNEKMNSLGQLVAGIAHEINNPISFIYSNLVPAKGYVQDLLNLVNVYQEEYKISNPRVQKIIKDIDLNFLIKDLQNIMDAMHRGAERIRQIVLSLNNFSGVNEAEIKPVDIHEGINNTLLILQHRLRETDAHPAIEVIKEYGKLPLVTCYSSQLNQVFMHLLNNAIDAILSTYRLDDTRVNKTLENLDRGIVQEERRTTKANLMVNHPIPNPQIRIYTELTVSNTVKIRIANNGPGIEDSVRLRLFDPFFTTKPVGSGTGLGLSISYQIVVQKHKGKLICCSSLGQGTEFSIEIPVNQTN